MIEIRNARIVRTFLGIEDHGIFTAVLTLNYGDSQQGFGTRLQGYNQETVYQKMGDCSSHAECRKRGGWHCG